MIAPVYGYVGQAVTVEGYADDFGNQIVAVEVSLDGGETWARFSTEASDSDKMVHWTYSYVPEQAGIYKLSVRSVTADGRKSPVCATTQLYIEE